MSDLSQETYWEAVRMKDLRMNGVFWYAVKTTGVYCRPGCPSRLPRRDNVEFFSDQAAARRAGFRPCLRCKPDQPDQDSRMVQKVCSYIQAHLDSVIKLKDIGQTVGLSPFYVQRKFKASLGISPRQYADQLRMEKFKSGVQRSPSVTEAMYDAGYGSSSRLYEKTGAQLGMTPAQYRRGGAGLRLRYTVTPSPLGSLLLAATDTGICAIRFGETVEQLQQEYPAAEWTRDDDGLKGWAEAVMAHVSAKQSLRNLPLDIRATAFQKQVWEHLRSIPVGKTESYSEVAAAIGRPTATRAVAQACAHNPVAIAIPCHRVVRSDGGLSGYRWGQDRKRQLLAMEQEP